MATRKVKDAKDLDTGELIYIKGHAKATYMSDGRTVEDAINAGGGGGGGITVETDPLFANSPAATITEDDIRGWNNDHAVVEDLNRDVAQLVEDVKDKQDAISDLATIRSGAEKGATAVQPEDVAGIVTEGGFVTAEDLAGVASSGSYNDLIDRPTFKTINGESILGSGDMVVGKITYFSEEDIIELSPNVVWIRRGSVVNSLQITGFASNGKDYEEYAYHFYTGTIADGSTVKLILPKGVKYANKEIFDALESDTHYELSVVRSNGVVKAVLTAFK